MAILDPAQWFTDPNDDDVDRPPIDSIVRIVRDYPGRWGARYRVAGFLVSKTYGLSVDLSDVASGQRHPVPLRAVRVDHQATADAIAREEASRAGGADAEGRK